MTILTTPTTTITKSTSTTKKTFASLQVCRAPHSLLSGDIINKSYPTLTPAPSTPTPPTASSTPTTSSSLSLSCSASPSAATVPLRHTRHTRHTKSHHMLINIVLMSATSLATILLMALMLMSASAGQHHSISLVQAEPLSSYSKFRQASSPGDIADLNDYYHQALNLLYKRQSICILRGKSCDHRPDDCCQDSACRCNLWGTNCKCYRMGLFQKWGRK